MTNDVEALQALLRQDFYAFIQKSFETVNQGRVFLPNWHIEAIAWHLDQCVRGDIKRLIIAMPPRHLKSLCASVALPAWVLGRDPTMRVVTASYSEDLASSFSRQTKEILTASWYRKVFPSTRLSRKKNTETEVVTTKGGCRYATSVGGTLTGRGGNLVIIDDPIKADGGMSEAERKRVIEWYERTVFSRLDNKKDDVIIVVMQRIHVEDLAGHLESQGGWTVLKLPAIAPEAASIPISQGEVYEREKGELLHPDREDKKVLDEAKKTLGSHGFQAQYQQDPVPPGGNMIKRKWFKRYGKRPDRDRFSHIVQSWDTASAIGEKNSYSVCSTWGVIENRYYLLDVFRDRLDFPNLKHTVVRLARAWGASPILIEQAASGLALLQSLGQETSLPAIAVRPKYDKETRVGQVSDLIEAGRVFLPQEEPWLADFEQEILAFPYGKHDDQVDSMTHFLRWAIARDSKPPQITCTVTGVGGRRFRDRYRERTGRPIF
jgi:predicted phage terminase large subunit-like protein